MNERSKPKPNDDERTGGEQSGSGRQSNGNSQTDAAPVPEGVLIISDEAEFARSVVGRWQMERSVPAFTLMTSELCKGAMAASHALAIVGPRIHRLEAILRTLDSSGISTLCVAPDGDASHIRALVPRILVLRQNDGWLDVLVQMAGEVLRRAEAGRRLQDAQRLVAASQAHATLGRYILEMRHGLNNCLTSVLGNAELLLLESGVFTAETRDQIQTIHTMALRMHEVLQRFSSLESEMQITENESHSETDILSQASVSGGRDS